MGKVEELKKKLLMNEEQMEMMERLNVKIAQGNGAFESTVRTAMQLALTRQQIWKNDLQIQKSIYQQRELLGKMNHSASQFKEEWDCKYKKQKNQYLEESELYQQELSRAYLEEEKGIDGTDY